MAGQTGLGRGDPEDLEREINRLVYELYELMEEEITAIERSLGLIYATGEWEEAALARCEGLGRLRAPGFCRRRGGKGERQL